MRNRREKVRVKEARIRADYLPRNPACTVWRTVPPKGVGALPSAHRLGVPAWAGGVDQFCTERCLVALRHIDAEGDGVDAVGEVDGDFGGDRDGFVIYPHS